jgi:hypothetical protein
LVPPEHVDWPVEQDDVPDWQRFPPGLHGPPAVQAVHIPLSQTWFMPQGVPSDAFPPVSVQMIPPSAHDAVPVWQGFVEGVHGAPSVHGAQAPPLQKRFSPHGCPLGAFPPGVHTGCPVEHTTPASEQDPASLQSIPGEHGEQVPW